MAFVKQASNNKTFFKSVYNIQYKPVEGMFNVYNKETKEKEMVNEITFTSIRNLQTVYGEGYTSFLFDNYFTNTITVVDDDTYRVIGKYKYSKEKKGLVNEFGDMLAEPRTALESIGIYKGKPCQVTIKGSSKMDIMKVNDEKTNADKVKAFMNGVTITMKPSELITTVGSGKKKKDIHLLEVTSEEGFIVSLEDDINNIVLVLEDTIGKEEDSSFQEETEESSKPKIEKIEGKIELDSLPF